jgi:carbonic anhydrase
MKLRASFIAPTIILGISLAFLLALAFAQETHQHHWAYDGADGPKNWGNLEPDYKPCALGHAQSPINIVHATKADLPPLQFAYSAVPLNIINNGHTVMVNYSPGSTLTVGDKTYTLKQFHFHHPSEEHIQGRGFDLVAHLVHSDSSGHLAVVAILFDHGQPNPFLDILWKNIPSEIDHPKDSPAITVNAQDLLPADHGYYTFSGSLTTPPCTEHVTWFVLKTPSSLATEQVNEFAKFYPRNARPVQPLYDREILQTK